MENQLKLQEERRRERGIGWKLRYLKRGSIWRRKCRSRRRVKRGGLEDRKMLSSQLEEIQQIEVSQRRELERLEKKRLRVLREQRETMFKPQMEELQEEIEKAKTAISTAMDKWIHNQAQDSKLAHHVDEFVELTSVCYLRTLPGTYGFRALYMALPPFLAFIVLNTIFMLPWFVSSVDKFTCFAVFVISDDKWSTEAMLEECIMEKLALIPDHAKLVVTPSEWKTIGTVPETLHVMYNVV
ncbi:hypothetical protein OS493_025350 [Desmophyllum pertusum]|uniref:Uncharacterized protein n=1 Tax=Desmophyllum pertusum TaxID=174260 RepID=A0A9W9ZAB1_9CNID|nr:hypothetical protein OS493_025350 [Desmophyllum pertusum]